MFVIVNSRPNYSKLVIALTINLLKKAQVCIQSQAAFCQVFFIVLLAYIILFRNQVIFMQKFKGGLFSPF
jgi:hypothetical protein